MTSCQTGILVLCLLSFTKAYLDIEELKTINYGIDLLNEPVLMTEDSPAGSVLLSNKQGQQFQCSFPDVQAEDLREKQEEKEAVETGIPDLLKPMESSPCLVHNKDWWSYEYCYRKHIRQFHVQDGKISGDIVYLGVYEEDHKWDTEDSETPDMHRLNRYHSQKFVNGTTCDLTGGRRKAEIRFLCEEGQGDYIARVDEPETCSYIVYVHTTKICHHPYLKPPISRKPVPITCHPLVNQEQYQLYLTQEEERKKELEEEQDQEEWIKNIINGDTETSINDFKEIARKRYNQLQKSNEQINVRQSESGESNLKNTQIDENKAQNAGEGASESSLQSHTGESSENTGKNVEGDSMDGKSDNADGKSDSVGVKSDSVDVKSDGNNADMLDDKSTEELMEELDVDKLVNEAVGRLAGLFEEELKKVKDQGHDEEEGQDETHGHDEDHGQGEGQKQHEGQGQDEDEEENDEKWEKMVEDDPDLQEKNGYSVHKQFKTEEEALKFMDKLAKTRKARRDRHRAETDKDQDTTAIQGEVKPATDHDAGEHDGITEDKDIVHQFDKGVDELTENEEHREGIALHKENIRHAVSSQFDDIVKEAQEELAKEGIDVDGNKEVTFKELAKTLSTLLNRLEKTEKELKEMDKNIAEAEQKEQELKEKIKQERDSSEEDSDEEEEEEFDEEESETEKSTDKTASDTDTESSNVKDKPKSKNIKFRVSHVKPGDKKLSSIKELPISDTQKAKLEASVKQQLHKAGVDTIGKNVQVKVVAASVLDDDDATVHVLSDDDSTSFNKMIFSILGGSQEAVKQEKKQISMEQNYNRVWGKSNKKSKTV